MPNDNISPPQTSNSTFRVDPIENIKSYLHSVKIPKYLEEEHSLRQEIDSKINQYLSNPESHPQYDHEWKKFISAKSKMVDDFYEDNLSDDQKDE